MRRLKGPSERLSELLEGLDAGELMSLPLPESGCEIVYPADADRDGGEAAAVVGLPVQLSASPEAGDLRAELQALKLMALHARAASEGIAQAKIDDAMEVPRPKEVLVALLLEQHSAAAAADSARRRSELGGLRLMELHRRAADEGVDTAALEDAMETARPKEAILALLL